MLEPVEEELGVRVVADRDEEAARRLDPLLAGQRVAQPDAAHLAVLDAEHVLDRVRRQDLEVRGAAGCVDHDPRGPELVATVHQHDLERELRQECRLLHRGVAAADDDHTLASEERGVADGAVADAAALQCALARQAELARRGAGRDDHRVRRNSCSPTYTLCGVDEKSTRVTSSVMNSVPKRSA